MKPKPDCFVCTKKHNLADCDQFKILSDHRKKLIVLDAGRCLNCLSLEHTTCNCMHQSKCRKCQRGHRLKHASVLHDYYVKPNVTVSDEAADTSCRAPSFTSAVDGDPHIVVNPKTMLLIYA